MKGFDDRVPMPGQLDNWFAIILEPYCGVLTFACVDAAWASVVEVLAMHVEREAATATREAVRDA